MKIVFLGTGDIGLPSLEALHNSKEYDVVSVFTQPDRPFGRKGELKASVIKEFAEKHLIPVFQPGRIKDQYAIEILSKADPDVLVVVAYGQILPKSVLSIPKISCINLHASLLPSYRGAAPIQAAILNGEEFTGMTVMFIGEGLDDGDILKSEKLKIKEGETGGSLHDRLASLGPELLVDSLKLLSRNEAPRNKQDHTQSSHVSKLTRSDGEIEWKHAAAYIERKIRAFYPWPGTFTYFPDGQLVKIFPEVLIGENFDEEAGKIMSINPNSLVISCGEGSIQLSKIQPSGRKKMTLSSYMSGKKINPGEFLGIKS